MSITFTSPIASTTTRTTVEPCLCAQFAECFCAVLDAAPQGGAITDAQVAELAAEANAECPWCKGTGIERRQVTTLPELNLCNANGTALLRALGLQGTTWGEAPIADFRRGLIRARNACLDGFTREGGVEHGAPRARKDGTIELRPVRVVWGALTREGILERLDRVQAVVDAHAAAGATVITWG